MPKQYVVFGRPVPRLGARRISFLLVSLSLFAVFSLLFTLPSAIPTSPSLQAAGHKFSIPKSFRSPWLHRLNPFKPPSHPPPRQKNDTDGDSWWYADFKWLSMPFSSSVTLDENRALLPMLKERAPIYCYYDSTVDKDRPSRDAESDLLLAWRRAWWAQGFKPIILGPAEAMNNPLYEEVQKLRDMTPSLKTDLMRWLAWENMEGGLLADHLLFPMGPYDDPLLNFLRRGEFPELTRWKDLDDGLFVGPKGQVGGAIKRVMASPVIKEAKDVLTALQADEKEDPFTVDDAPKSLAYYSARQIEAHYAKVGEAIAASRASGLESLTQLITSHLHLTWQNLFPDGIAVVKPLPQHTTRLIKPAYELASRLARCPESPLPNSCPPNLPRCTPCDDSKPMKITTPPHYDNATTLYTIGTVPHPYTSSTLNALRSEVTIRWIRRDSPRDAWLTDLTASLLPGSVSASARILRFKEAVASDSSPPHTLWLPAEQPVPDDLDWHFGFSLPSDTSSSSSTTKGEQGEEEGEEEEGEEEEGGEEEGEGEEEGQEATLLARAQTIVLAGSKSQKPPKSKSKSKSKSETPGSGTPPPPTQQDLALRDAIEAWNLADTEAWRFARAYLARKSVERRTWEEAEAKYAGGMGSDGKWRRRRKERQGQGQGKGQGWDRWLDLDG
ncbi:hypothetical protein VTK56DRAFT_419 [Thermocarpiscus australiensis]